MQEGEFLAYAGDARTHDAKIIKFQNENGSVIITLQSSKGEIFQILFTDVEAVKENQVQGMFLFSLSELATTKSQRWFVFVNHDEEDDAFLEIWAKDLIVM